MFESYVAIHLARKRYRHCVVVFCDLDRRADLRQWLRDAELRGSYRVYVPLHQAEPNADLSGRTEVYFSDEDAAFAFKMRWV